LHTLHKLAGKELIMIAADKTNYQYVSELKNAMQRNDFAALTLNYEYVWYGEFAIDEQVYGKIRTGFKTFNDRI
jgi:hypothetical protein